MLGLIVFIKIMNSFLLCFSGGSELLLLLLFSNLFLAIHETYHMINKAKIKK